MKSEVYNIDCMTYMAGLPDGAFDLAVVDVPYGINAGDYSRGGTQYGNAAATSFAYERKEWDKTAPDAEYFKELRRVSVNQIIWGANHFIQNINLNSPAWIVWDKDNGNNGYADCELAWTSFVSATRKVKIRWHGMLQENMANKEERIHPTQKPASLYRWILQTYAKPGQTIFDSHLGSQSSRLAAWDLGFDFYGTELDPDYFKSGCERFERHCQQPKLFAPTPVVEIQDGLFG